VDPIKPLAALGFGAASFVRRTKVFHPHGAVHDARVELSGETRAPGFLGEAGGFDAIVRLSRGAGTPKPLPDFIGLALRLLDAHGDGAHQDFLLLTSGEGAVAQHTFRPSLAVDDGPYSSVLPYNGGGQSFVVAALPQSETRFTLGITGLRARKMLAIGELVLGARQPDEANSIRFNPWNTGGGIEPSGWLNRLREAAYPASQAGWEASSDGASDMAVSGDVA
jgi:hypothetical protein